MPGLRRDRFAAAIAVCPGGLMDLFVFRTADGYDVAIPEDDIAAVWQAKTPGHCLIERVEDRPDIEVVCDFDKLVLDRFDHVDARPSTRKAKRPAVELDARRKRAPRTKPKEVEKC